MTAMGWGWGQAQMFPQEAPSLQELEDRHLHLQDHIPSQQPGGVGVLRSEASAQRGLLQQSLLRPRPRPGPGLSELHSRPEAPPKGLPALLGSFNTQHPSVTARAPLTLAVPSLHPSQALPPTELLLAWPFLSLHFLKGLPGEHTGPSNPSGH